jgi:hypothetical protein
MPFAALKHPLIRAQQPQEGFSGHGPKGFIATASLVLDSRDRVALGISLSRVVCVQLCLTFFIFCKRLDARAIA